MQELTTRDFIAQSLELNTICSSIATNFDQFDQTLSALEREPNKTATLSLMQQIFGSNSASPDNVCHVSSNLLAISQHPLFPQTHVIQVAKFCDRLTLLYERTFAKTVQELTKSALTLLAKYSALHGQNLESALYARLLEDFEQRLENACKTLEHIMPFCTAHCAAPTHPLAQSRLRTLFNVTISGDDKSVLLPTLIQFLASKYQALRLAVPHSAFTARFPISPRRFPLRNNTSTQESECFVCGDAICESVAFCGNTQCTLSGARASTSLCYACLRGHIWAAQHDEYRFKSEWCPVECPLCKRKHEAEELERTLCRISIHPSSTPN